MAWRHDIQHNDIQQIDTQHNGLVCATQHKLGINDSVSIAIMLSVVMLSVAIY
jgi:hypothetical protein